MSEFSGEKEGGYADRTKSQVTIYNLRESLLEKEECDIDVVLRNKYNIQQRKHLIVDRTKGKIIDSRSEDYENVLYPATYNSLLLPSRSNPISDSLGQYDFERIEGDWDPSGKTRKTFSVWDQNWKQLDKLHQSFLQSIVKNNAYSFFEFLEKRNHNKPIDINYRYQSNWSPVHYAAMKASIHIFSRIINHPDLDVNALTDFGQTPLHIAAKVNQIQNCQLLLSAGACIDQRDHDLNTALHYSAQLGYQTLVELLLKNGASKEVKNSQGMTPGELATSHMIKQMLKLQEKEQIDILYRNRQNHKNMIQKMLEKVPQKYQDAKQEKKHKISTSYGRKKNIFKMYELIKEKQKIQNISLGSFRFYKKIGQGAFGEVYVVKKNKSQRLYALKAVRKERVFGTNLYRYIQTQKQILSFINHPFIVKLRYAFQTQTYLFLVMDYCEGGDLSRLLEKKKRLDQKTVRNYACEILLGLEALHQNKIIYRDLKPQNIVLDKDGHALITDFGLSKKTQNMNDLNKSFCGTPAYLPLQIINKKGHNRMADWYEFGIVLYQLMTGTPPFYADTKAELYDLVRQGVIRFPKSTPEVFRDLIKRLLAQNPQRRLGFENDAESIKQHPWFQDVDWDAVYQRRLVMPVIENKVRLGDPIKTKFHDIKSDKFQIPQWSFMQ